MSIAMTLRPSLSARDQMRPGACALTSPCERRAGAAAEQKMITLFQRLADGELSLKSPRADPDADCGVGSGIGSGKHRRKELRRGRLRFRRTSRRQRREQDHRHGYPADMEPLRYGRIAHFEEIPGARRTKPCGGTWRTTCRSRHAGRRTRRALLPARHRPFSRDRGVRYREKIRPPPPASGWARVRADSLRERWPAGPRRLPACVLRKGRDEARRGNRRHTGCAGSAAPWRKRKAQGLSEPFPLGEKLRRPAAVPIKENSSRHKTRKPGEADSPGHLRDVFTPSVFTETNSRISTYALRYSLSSFPARKKGRRLGSTATFSPVRGLRPA